MNVPVPGTTNAEEWASLSRRLRPGQHLGENVVLVRTRPEPFGAAVGLAVPSLYVVGPEVLALGYRHDGQPGYRREVPGGALYVYRQREPAFRRWREEVARADAGAAQTSFP